MTIGLRWTIGDVSEAGFEALRLSIESAWNLFGACAKLAVCVNTISATAASARVGALPCPVRWLQVNDQIPHWLARHVSAEMAEGVAWKFAPVRVFPALHEVSLDNDVILWNIPDTMRRWLEASEPACLMAADLQSALGQFGEICGYRQLNSGIRGLPPHFDFETKLKDMLARTGIILSSELDEQGLQAAVLLQSKLFVVPTEDVSICSPFPNHEQRLGECGVHFVGLNPKRVPWTLDGRGGHEVIREHWHGYTQQLERLIFGKRSAAWLRTTGSWLLAPRRYGRANAT